MQFLCLAFLLVFASLAAPGAARAEKRLALVVGVQNYQHLPRLKNTLGDAELIGDRLKEANFDVEIARDLAKTGLSRAIRDFARKVESAGPDVVVVIYYAGHGVRDEKEVNYVIGADAELRSEVDLPLEALPIASLLQTLEQAKPKIMFAIFDACRDNPLPASHARGDKRGLAPETALPAGLLIAYATAPNSAADDGQAGGHSPFAAALAEELRVQGVEARRMFQLVTRRVLDATAGRQHPWVEDPSLTEDFFFHPGAPTTAAVPATAGPQMTSLEKGEIEYGEAVIANTPEAYNEWLRKYPDHPRKANVMSLLQRLQEEYLWKRAEAATSVEDKIGALEHLLDAFSTGVYAQKAREKLQELKAPQPPPVPHIPSAVSSSPLRSYENMDAPGNDRGRWIENITAEGCEIACQQDAGCVGYTYNRRRSVCIPKDAILRLAPAAEAAVTGVLINRTQSPAAASGGPNAQRYENMDAPGDDRGGWLRNVASEQECLQACAKDGGCAGYTYNKRRAVCITKNHIGQLVAAPEPAVTGVFTDRASTPPVARAAPAGLSRHENADAPGNDRGPWRHNVSSATCEELCIADSGCAGYTYNRVRSTCILKNVINRLVPAPEPAVTVMVRRRD